MVLFCPVITKPPLVSNLLACWFCVWKLRFQIHKNFFSRSHYTHATVIAIIIEICLIENKEISLGECRGLFRCCSGQNERTPCRVVTCDFQENAMPKSISTQTTLQNWVIHAHLYIFIHTMSISAFLTSSSAYPQKMTYAFFSKICCA